MKAFVKNTVYWLFVVLASPVILLFHLLALAGNHDSLTAGFSQFLSLFPGQLGNYFRKAALRFIITRCDQDSLVAFGVLLSHQDTEIEAGVYIGPQCNIGKCRIEKNCLLGSGVHIMSGKKQHSFTDLDTPIRDQGGRFEKVVIGEDTWIGNGALIMANVGKKCIIGAGSVVTDDVEDYSIVVGNPAKVVKKRVPQA
ncbi:MAG TPA: acyltransferase [Dongiaceae bacterium]|nr:acyltransferase [Dongiaceae bacterium]